MTVSLPTTLSVGEGDGIVEVCATLSAIEDIEIDFNITLLASDETGMLKQGSLSYTYT